MSDSGGFFRVRLPSIKLAGASLSTLGRGRMGIFCSRLRTGRAVAAPAQRRLFSVSARPQARVFRNGTLRFDSQTDGAVH
jgi:hypothetical protein